MLDDFFIRALLAGIGIALVAGPFGCFIVWRRMAYFGDTLSHAGLLGVALALALEINVMLAVFAVSGLLAVLLVLLSRRPSLSRDALLGLLAHSALAIGLVGLSFMAWVRVDLLALLFGDILAVTRMDLVMIYGGGVAVLAGLGWIWHRLFAATVSPELAAAEGANPDRMELVFVLLMAAVIAIAMKIVGVLLITALLIMPSAGARRLSGGPEQMALISSLLGCAAVIGGLYASRIWDTPSGPSIVVAALLIFLASLLPGLRISRAD